MEIQSFTIHDSGDPSVGIPATQYELTGPFIFDEPEHLEDFKRDLAKLFSEHDFIQGKVMVTTDVEFTSRKELEEMETLAWMETMRNLHKQAEKDLRKSLF